MIHNKALGLIMGSRVDKSSEKPKCHLIISNNGVFVSEQFPVYICINKLYVSINMTSLILVIGIIGWHFIHIEENNALRLSKQTCLRWASFESCLLAKL